MREQGFSCEELERYFKKSVRLLMFAGEIAGGTLGWYKVEDVCW